MHGIWDMAVWNDMLVFPCADYQGLLAYYAREDAFFRLTSPIDAPVTDVNYEMVYAIAVWHGVLYISIPKHGVWRMSPTVKRQRFTQWDYSITTSWFDAGLEAVNKLYRDVTLDVHYWGNDDRVLVQYRVTDDAGEWLPLGIVTETSAQTLAFPATLLGKKLQLKFICSFGTDSSGLEFGGFHVRYTVEPEVTRSWSFTALCIDNQVLQDGTTEPHTGEELRNHLWALRDSHAIVQFRDTDDQVYDVIVRSADEWQPNVNMEDGFETEVAVQLWEV